MRICIFTDSFLPYLSGVSSAVYNQANEMARRGHEVTIFHPRPRKRDRGQAAPGLHEAIDLRTLPLAIPAKGIPKLQVALPLFLHTYRRLRKEPPDLVHAHTEFGCGLEGMFLGRWKRAPVVGTFHTFFAEPDYLRQFHLPSWPIVRRMMWRYSVGFYNKCSRIISPSRSVRDHLVARGLKREPIVLSNGIETARRRPEAEIAAFRASLGIGDFAFIYVGRVSPEKSLPVALRAFKKVLERHPKAMFVIVGNGPADTQIDVCIRDLGIAQSVVRTGRIERGRLMEENYPLLGDVFVTASTTENQPISLLEAMAFGLPLIGPRAKGIPELVDHERNGLLFEPEDVDGMARGMERTLEDVSLRRSLARASLESASEHRLENVGDRLESIYEEAVAEPA